MTDPAAGPPRKRVDEDWKKRAVEEKSRLTAQPAKGRAGAGGTASAGGGEGTPGAAGSGPGAPAKPDPRFLSFLASLVSEARVRLGEIPDPMTGMREPDLNHARYLIEVIRVLQEKTRGNLSADEDRQMTGALVELQMRYVRAAGPGPEVGEGP